MKTLFIGTGFYQYDHYIQAELERYSEVFYINSKETESTRAIAFSLSERINCYYFFSRLAAKDIQDKINSLENVNFDLVFVIKGEYLNDENIKSLKDRNPGAKFILYLWDAWIKHRNRDVLKKHFTIIYSFDARDCKEYGFKLRPLFYVNKTEPVKRRKDAYNVSFVGGNHSGRLDYLKSIKEICCGRNLTYNFKLVVGRFEYLKHILIYRDKYSSDIISKEYIAYEDYLDIIDRSIAVIDIPTPMQSGLTIRTIEALSRGAKVVTTNSFVKYYDKLPSSLVLVVNSTKIDNEELIRFVLEPGGEILDEYYSLESFVKEFIY